MAIFLHIEIMTDKEQKISRNKLDSIEQEILIRLEKLSFSSEICIRKSNFTVLKEPAIKLDEQKQQVMENLRFIWQKNSSIH